MSNIDRIINATFAALSIPTNGYKSAADMMDNAFPIVNLSMGEEGRIKAKFEALNEDASCESSIAIGQREFDAVANLIETIAQKDNQTKHEGVISIDLWLGCDLSVYIKLKDNGFRSLVNII